MLRAVPTTLLVACTCASTLVALAAAPKKHKAAAKKTTKSTKHKLSAEQASSLAHMSTPTDPESTPAFHYGQLSQTDCEAELTRRKIDFTREADTRGILAPVRLHGPLHGVTFKTDLKDKERTTTPYEVGDCRLILALDDFAQILVRHDIVEVRHYSMWRPPSKSWPDGKIGTRHDGAMALDAGRFIDKDGATLDVDKDFHGAIDAKTCGDGAGPDPATPEALRLRSILCDAVDAHLFNVVLTPNYNKPHHNHFHLEVTSGVKWFLVH